MHSSPRFPARVLASAALSGTVSALVSAATLGVLSRLEGSAAVQPLNATSHWWHGDDAARRTSVDMSHTGVGFATHQASSVFWALLFETLRARGAGNDIGSIARDAAIVSATASAVDYGLVSRHLTPGWELVLPMRSVAAGFVAMALGLTLGGLLSRSLPQPDASDRRPRPAHAKQGNGHAYATSPL